MADMKYRPDIDGLRAVAVLAVVFHHLSTVLAPGGYIGVDVFFVISGYLITGIISKEIIEDRFSFGAFYVRRMRRLFPALFAMLAATLVAGWFLLLPSDYLSTSRAAFGTLFFSSNVVFWQALAEGYFAADAKLNPLLHTWSLGVEEQFYLFFPILLLLGMRYARRYVVAILIVCTLVIFIATSLLVKSHEVAVFFLSPFRAWELSVGSLLALNVVPPIRSLRVRQSLAGAGLLAILATTFLYDTQTPFPGLATLAPVFGAAAIIHAGIGGHTLVGRVLQWRPVVYIGLISYSLYLWHWPLISLVKQWFEFRILSVPTGGLLAGSLILAMLSYHFVEQPFRRVPKASGSGGFVLSSIACALAIVVFTGFGARSRGFESRFSPAILAVDHTRQSSAMADAKACEARIATRPLSLCVLGDTSKAPDIMLWGDSHALAWAPGFDVALRNGGHSALLAANSACPPMVGIRNDADPACHAHNEAVLDLLRGSNEIRVVVMSGFWSKYFGDSNISIESLEGVRGNAKVAPVALRVTVEKLAEAGKQVFILGPVPTYGTDVPLAIAHEKMMGIGGIKSSTLLRVVADNSLFYRSVQDVDVRLAGFLDVAQWMCQPECMIYSAGFPVYRDSNHLSNEGAVMFAPKLEQAIRLLSPHTRTSQTPRLLAVKREIQRRP